MDTQEFTIYVGMALTDAPEEFRTIFHDELKTHLRQIPNVKILDFIGLENGTALDVFKHDGQCTVLADLCVFVLDYPSIGLGMEIILRHNAGKRSLFFASPEKKVTRMLTGYLEKQGWPLHRYEDPVYIAEMVQAHMLTKDPAYWP